MTDEELTRLEGILSSPGNASETNRGVALTLITEVRRLRAVLKHIADRDEFEMQTARTLHYDMQGWARAGLEVQP
jgi:hypothetical protein